MRNLNNNFTGPFNNLPTTYTAAALAALGAPTITFPTAIVKDGSTATDCTIGGGSTPVLCWWNGSSWQAVSGAGGLAGGVANEVALWGGASTLNADSTLSKVSNTWQFTLPISFSGITNTTPIMSGIPANAAVVTNFNANFLQGCSWTNPCALGTAVPADGHFIHIFGTDLTLSGTGDVDLKTVAEATELTNSATGTTANAPVCLDSSGNAINCSNGATQGIVGICDPRDATSTCGTTGTAHVATSGQINCVFDSAASIVAGHFVGMSATADKCTDIGANFPTSGEVVGMALASAAAGSTVNTLLLLNQATALPTRYTVRKCEIHIWGTGASSVLQDTDDEVASCYNSTGATLTITAVRCWANAGTPTITPILTGGAANSILTGALTCGTGTWAAGTLNGTPTLTSGSTIDDNITTAGGVATNIRIVIEFTL